MNDLEKRRATMLKRVAAFGEKHQTEITAGSKLATLFAAVSESVETLEHLVPTQISSGGAAVSGTEAKEAQFDALEALMRRLSRTARSIEPINGTRTLRFTTASRARLEHDFFENGVPRSGWC